MNRYTVTLFGERDGNISVDLDGEWVKYEDVVALGLKLAKANAELQRRTERDYMAGFSAGYDAGLNS